jgi:hypothetical protein
MRARTITLFRAPHQHVSRIRKSPFGLVKARRYFVGKSLNLRDVVLVGKGTGCTNQVVTKPTLDQQQQGASWPDPKVGTRGTVPRAFACMQVRTPALVASSTISSTGLLSGPLWSTSCKQKETHLQNSFSPVCLFAAIAPRDSTSNLSVAASIRASSVTLRSFARRPKRTTSRPSRLSLCPPSATRLVWCRHSSTRS